MRRRQADPIHDDEAVAGAVFAEHQAWAAARDSEVARDLWPRMEDIPPHPYLDAGNWMRS